MADIDRISRDVPQLCKVAPNTNKYHIEDVHRAGGIYGHPGRAGPCGQAAHRRAHRAHQNAQGALDAWDIVRNPIRRRPNLLLAGPAGVPHASGLQPKHPLAEPGRDRAEAASARTSTLSARKVAWPC